MSNCIECGKYGFHHKNYIRLCYYCYTDYCKIEQYYNYKSKYYRFWIFGNNSIYRIGTTDCKYCLADLCDVRYPLCHHCIIPIKNKYNNINIL